MTIRRISLMVCLLVSSLPISFSFAQVGDVNLIDSRPLFSPVSAVSSEKDPINPVSGETRRDYRDFRINRDRFQLFCNTDGVASQAFTAEADSSVSMLLSENTSNELDTFFAGLKSPRATPPQTQEWTADITTNTIWQADTVYHITTVVNVQAMLVIEPGTTITFGPNGSLKVNNGGVLLANGNPHNFPQRLILFTSDSAAPTSGSYPAAIVFEETASSLSKLSYSFIEYAQIGVKTENVRLDIPLQNNYLYKCNLGIQEYGVQLTDIKNNLISNSADMSIDIHMASISGQEDSATYIEILGNTCHHPVNHNIAVHGAQVANNAGAAVIVNNAISDAENGYNIYFDMGTLFYYQLLCNGYYNAYHPAPNDYTLGSNDLNGNFYNDWPVVATESPYAAGSLYLSETSPFREMGYTYVINEPTLMGSTTTTDNACDQGWLDIGFHFPNFDTVNVGEYYLFLSADLNQDGTVDATDLAILRNNYGQSGQGDINGDGIVDAHDLRILRKLWGQTGIAHPNVSLNVLSNSDNLSNLSDMVYMRVSGYSTDTSDAFFFVDGVFVGKLRNFRDEQKKGVDTSQYNNGGHQAKVVCINESGYITLSANVDLTFNNILYCQCQSGSYRQGRDYQFKAIYDGTENLSISLKNVYDNTVWPTTQLEVSGNSINVTIPQTSLTDQLYQLVIGETSADQSGGQVVTSTSYKKWKKILSKEFKKEDITTPIVALITLNEPDTIIDDWDCVAQVIKTLNRYPNYIVLYNGKTTKNCTWENVSYLIKNADTLGINYWYHAGHDANTARRDEYGRASFVRTGIEINNRNVISYVKSDFGGQVPSWFKEDKYGATDKGVVPYDTILSLTSSYLSRGYSPFKLVFMDTCRSEEYLVTYHAIPHGTNEIPHDLAYALGIYTDMNKVYFGWETKRYYNAWWVWETSDSEFVEYFWKRLGLLDSVGQAWYTSGSYYETANIFERTNLLTVGDPWTVWLHD